MEIDFFQIHYCMKQKLKGPGKVMNGMTRTLQHHEMIFVSETNDHITIGETRYPMRKG